MLSHLLDGEPSPPVGPDLVPWALSGFRRRLTKGGQALTVTFAAAVLTAGCAFYGLVVLLGFKKPLSIRT
ncbi:hypothetical protein [Streptomyces sp. NBC_01483]|uniref:hypothetical protein n=1 Tax=Streptomyces sp. NBC_01483 TaxID=2903883 RepID=UPI002E2EFA4A|nr:hypothetical protein [Streptomyces sp. NBC_01483]